jgi:hypothetical protein
MVRANGANTNTEIRTPLSCPRRPEDRGSMHPSRPRQAEWVARWLSGQRRARGPRGQASGAARAHLLWARSLTRRVNDLRRRGPRARISGGDK